MKTKTKNDLNDIVNVMIEDFNTLAPDEKGKEIPNLIKVVNVVKEIESQTIENQIKQKRFKLDVEKVELDKQRMDMDREKLKMDQEKLENDQEKFRLSTNNEIRKIELDDSKLEFEKKKFNMDIKKSKTDRIFNGTMKGLEVGLPAMIYGVLAVLALKATYKDDVRVPSETWGFIRSVFKK